MPSQPRVPLAAVVLLLAAALVPGSAVLASPTAAQAAAFEVRGGGFGHGVGMSQYGAYGQALEGRGYRRILSHYYRDTGVGDVGGRRVRVLLQASRPAPASFSNAKRVDGERLRPDRTYTVQVKGGSRLVVRTGGGRRVAGSRGPLRVRGERDRVRLGGTAINGLSGGLYRGRMEFRPGLSGGITAVNDVGIDDYVRGVISAEMPASWHDEALRAQAVVARSYAISTDKGSDIFDHYPDTRSQVYRGVAAEYSSTNRAVRSTSGEVVRYRGGVAQTYFFSTSGGHTEDSENVFGGRLPYLRGVRDPQDDISPYHSWRYRFSRGELEQRLGSYVSGRLRRVRTVQRGASPRIIRARVIGSGGSTEVSGATLRSRLGTYDIPSSIRPVRQSTAARSSASSAIAGAATGGRGVATAVVPRPPRQ